MLTRGSLADRRRIGSYYTPTAVTDILCEWAIRAATDLVLEPSFGGCEFLESSARRLKQVGCDDPNLNLFGCDIDSHAFHQLSIRINHAQVRNHFIFSDFLQVLPDAFGGRAFQAVVGNPPYVRHHDLTAAQRASAKHVRDALLPRLNMQASLWAYFILHACRFLADGGRIAWILPSTFMHAYYAQPIRHFLRRHFGKVTVIGLQERIFRLEGAEEGTVIVVGEGWTANGTGSCAEHEVPVESVKEARNVLLGASSRCTPASKKNPLLEALAVRASPLGAFCRFSIGVVTGDANFFLFNRDKAKIHGIRAAHLRLVVSKASQIRGLEVSREDLRSAYAAGARTRILNPSRLPDLSVRKYLESMPKERKESNLTFKKRTNWYCPLDNKKADGFFTGMSHDGPRLVLSASGITCTNSLYRVVFRNEISQRTRRLVALSLVTTFSQLSAEFVGRSYSAGMLKHEPSEAAKILVLLPNGRRGNIARAFHAVNALLKVGRAEAATQIADKFFSSMGCFTLGDIAALRLQLDRVRSMRRMGKYNRKPSLPVKLDKPKHARI